MCMRTCVLAVVCVAHKLRPCPSCSRRRDRNNCVQWRSLYKGGVTAGFGNLQMVSGCDGTLCCGVATQANVRWSDHMAKRIALIGGDGPLMPTFYMMQIA